MVRCKRGGEKEVKVKVVVARLLFVSSKAIRVPARDSRVGLEKRGEARNGLAWLASVRGDSQQHAGGARAQDDDEASTSSEQRAERALLRVEVEISPGVSSSSEARTKVSLRGPRGVKEIEETQEAAN